MENEEIRLQALKVLNEHFKYEGQLGCLEDRQVKLVLDSMIEFIQSNAIFSLPSHAHLTKKALEVHGDNESELNMAKHRAWIDGGVWMLDECIKHLNGNKT